MIIYYNDLTYHSFGINNYDKGLIKISHFLYDKDVIFNLLFIIPKGRGRKKRQFKKWQIVIHSIKVTKIDLIDHDIYQ